MYISEYDEHSFELVASVLWQINPCLREKYASKIELIESMKFQTGCHLHEPGFWGTGGYYVTVIDRGERGYYAMASLGGYVVSEYLKDHSEDDWNVRVASKDESAPRIV
jgi:hypothetical protein